MRIVFVSDVIYPFTKGGSEIRTYEIAKRLAERGYKTTIIGGKFWVGPNKIYYENVEIIGLSKIDYPRTTIKSLKLMFKTFVWLMQNDFDLMENQHYIFYNCYLLKLISIIKRKPVVITWHQHFGNYLNEYYKFPKNFVAKNLEKFSLNLTKSNIAVSEAVKDDLIKAGMKKSHVSIFENGVDLEKIEKAKPSKSKSDLIFVGRLSYQKNVELLIKTVSEIKKENAKIKTFIVGSGEKEKELKKLTKALNLEENIIFLGNKDHEEIFSLMKSSKIFILPSIFEGFPLTAIEANACGLPIITPNFKQNRTKYFIKESGIVCEPNPKDMAKEINKLLRDKKLRARMGERGKIIVKKMDWDNITNKIEKYYRSLRK